MTRTDRQRQKIALIALSAMLLIVLGCQFQSLFSLPQYDGARWWGDEFGQIIELKSELEGGYARIPTGKGATVEITNGIVRGNSWMAAFVYGLPALIFYPSFDLVTIGRVVTAALSLLLILVVGKSLNKLRVSSLLAFAAILILIANRSFLFASHAARLDIAAGLAVIGWVAYCALKLRSTDVRPLSKQWFFVFGAVTFFFVTFSIHLLTLLGPVAIYAVYRLGKSVRLTAFLYSALGVSAVGVLLLVVYLVTGAPVTLFGETSHHIQSYDVLGAMPAFHPFSFSTQFANLVQRFQQFAVEAPVILALTMLSIIVTILLWQSLTREARFFSICTLIVTISWLIFQSSAIYYLLHLTPLLIVQAMSVMHTALEAKSEGSYAFGILAVIATIMHLGDAAHANTTAETIHRENQRAVSLISPKLKESNARVIAQYPAVPQLHQQLGDRLVTTHFLNFPRENKQAHEVLREQNVRSMVLYRTSRIQDYSFEVAPLWEIARQHGTLDTIITGRLFDVGVDYFKGHTGEDTLYLFRLDR